jgi:prepilin signal peptidase PulO-like enzyme (type II secretory pathway)
VGGVGPLDWFLIAVLAGYTASFVCVVVERRAEGRKPDGRSTCVCGTQIPMYRNIPVISWVTQRGRAACCGARIPAWYVVAEVGTIVAGLAGAALAGWPGALAGIALAVVMTVVWYRTRKASPARADVRRHQ